MEIKEGELLVNVVYENIPIGIDYEGVREIETHLNREIRESENHLKSEEGVSPIDLFVLSGILMGIAKDIREENYQGGEEVVFRSADGLTKKMEVNPVHKGSRTLILPLIAPLNVYGDSEVMPCAGRTYEFKGKTDKVGRRIFEEAL